MYVDRLVGAHDRLENPPSFWFVVIPEEVYELGRPQSRVSKAERVEGEVRISASRARYLEVQPTLFGEEEKEAEVYKYAAHFRRQLKARLLKDRIVTQIVRETTLAPGDFVSESGWPRRRLEDPATVAWKLCTGAYYKAGGRPWQLADVRPGVCYVGLVYKRTNPFGDERYACCAAQMFLSDGDGVVFRGALGPWYSPDTRQYHLNLPSARSLNPNGGEGVQAASWKGADGTLRSCALGLCRRGVEGVRTGMSASNQSGRRADPRRPRRPQALPYGQVSRHPGNGGHHGEAQRVSVDSRLRAAPRHVHGSGNTQPDSGQGAKGHGATWTRCSSTCWV